MRLDKYLSDSFLGTRSEVKKMIKRKEITVNDMVITSDSYNINPKEDVVLCKGKKVKYQEHYYFVLNKPAGYITATKDNINKTVIDLFIDIPCMLKDKLFPVGRLDKDTEGLLILTTDGEFSHKITAPSNNIEKTYYVEYSGTIMENAEEILSLPITLKDGTIFLPSKIKTLTTNSCYLTITEGQYHQVKRIIHYLGGEVTYLKRTKIGEFLLPDNIIVSKYQEYTKEELESLIYKK